MGTRIVIGTLLLLAVAGLLGLDHALATRAFASSFVALLGLVGWWELAAMSGVRSRERGGGVGLLGVGLLGTAGVLASGWQAAAGAPSAQWLLAAAVQGTFLGAFACVVFRRDFEKSLPPVLVTAAGPLLLGLSLSFLIRVYHLDHGLLRVGVLVLGVKGTDIAAYFTGRFLGRRHFLAVSPRKTLEGCLGALAFSALWFAGAGALWPEAFFPWLEGAGVGIILSVLAQVGDFSESLLKRSYQVKDSSRLLPQFGGVLDLIDSFLFTGFLFWSLL